MDLEIFASFAQLQEPKLDLRSLRLPQTKWAD